MGKFLYNHKFRGLVGDKVYYKRADEYFARIRVDEVKASQSEEAVGRRLQFGTIGKLGRAVRYVTTESFPNRPKRETATNTFVRLNYECCTVEDARAALYLEQARKLRLENDAAEAEKTPAKAQ